MKHSAILRSHSFLSFFLDCSGAFEVVVFLPGEAKGKELYSKLQKGCFPDFQQLADVIAAYLDSSAGNDSLVPKF